MEEKIAFELNKSQQKDIINLLGNENISEVKKIITSYGNKLNESSSLLYFSGIIASKEGNFEISISQYLKAIEINPTFLEAINNLGLVYLNLKEYELAKKYFIKSIEVNKDFFHGHYNLGVVNYELMQFNDAELNFKQSVKINKKFDKAYNGLGNLYIKTNKLNLAIKAFESALKINPSSKDILCNLASALIESKQYNKSLEILNKIVLNNNNNNIMARVYSNLSSAYYGLGKTEDSANYAKKALQINPNSIAALQNLANYSEAIGDKENTEELYKKILNLNINKGYIFNSYVKDFSLNRSNKIVLEVEKNYENNISIGMDRVYQAFGLFHAYENEQNYEKAYKYLVEANNLHSQIIPYDFNKDLQIFKAARENFSSDLFDLLGDGGSLDPTPIFVLGMPRSGSTLVEQILDSHSKIYGMGEVPILNKIIAKHEIRYSKLKSLSLDQRESIGNDYIREIRSFTKSDEEFIVDKIPQNFLFIGIIKLILPKAKIINTHRNPLDNCFSIYSQAFSDGQSYSFDLVNTFNYYQQYKNLLNHWIGIFPEFIFNIKYEKLIENSEFEIKNLLKFCSLSYESDCLKFYTNKRTVTTPSSSQVRKKLYNSSIKKYLNYKNYTDLARRYLKD